MPLISHLFKNPIFWIVISLFFQYPVRILVSVLFDNKILSNAFVIYENLQFPEINNFLYLSILISIPGFLYFCKKIHVEPLNTVQLNSKLLLFGIYLLSFACLLISSPLISYQENIHEAHMYNYGSTKFVIISNVFFLLYINFAKKNYLFLLSLLPWVLLPNDRWVFIYIAIILTFFYFEKWSLKQILVILSSLFLIFWLILMYRMIDVHSLSFFYKTLLATIFSHFDSLSSLAVYTNNFDCIDNYKNSISFFYNFHDAIPEQLRIGDKTINIFNSLCFTKAYHSWDTILQLPLLLDLKIQFNLTVALLVFNLITYFYLFLWKFFIKNIAVLCYIAILLVKYSELTLSGNIRIMIDLFLLIILILIVNYFNLRLSK